MAPSSDNDLKSKIRAAPSAPGVYIFRAISGRPIYVGKAINLRKRIQQYFRKSSAKFADPKFRSLVNSIADLEYYRTNSENEALLLETRLIKEYAPQFNVLMRDDKRFLMIKIDLREKLPAIKLVRLKKNDNCKYFGPFPHGGALREMTEFLSAKFGLRVCGNPEPDISDYRRCVAGAAGRCCAPCIGKTTEENYRKRVDSLIEVLNGNTKELELELETLMKEASENANFEKAANLRDMAANLKSLFKPERKFFKTYIKYNTGADSIKELKNVLGLKREPTRIEAFDISNISGTFATASMVAFENGKPDKKNYRRYKIECKNTPDDFAMMEEVVGRRVKRLIEEKKTLPDLILIDGGKGQLSAAKKAVEKFISSSEIALAGIAKKQEEIFLPQKDESIILDRHSPALKLLQAIRDEAHRFAINYHRTLRDKRIEDSLLDEIPNIGKKRKIAILKEFGSIENLRKYSVEEITKRVPSVPAKIANAIFNFLKK